jgi:hypothetical protein
MSNNDVQVFHSFKRKNSLVLLCVGFGSFSRAFQGISSLSSSGMCQVYIVPEMLNEIMPGTLNAISHQARRSQVICRNRLPSHAPMQPMNIQ